MAPALLLDTHALLWWLAEPEELGKLHSEVPERLRPQVNRWLKGYGAATRLWSQQP